MQSIFKPTKFHDRQSKGSAVYISSIDGSPDVYSFYWRKINWEFLDVHSRFPITCKYHDFYPFPALRSTDYTNGPVQRSTDYTNGPVQRSTDYTNGPVQLSTDCTNELVELSTDTNVPVRIWFIQSCVPVECGHHGQCTRYPYILNCKLYSAVLLITHMIIVYWRSIVYNCVNLYEKSVKKTAIRSVM